MAKKDKEEKGKGENHGRWRCPTCKVEADIEGRNLHVYVAGNQGHTWPLHYDCEFVNDIDHIDFSKLEKIG